jgi:hypothetical protein
LVRDPSKLPEHLQSHIDIIQGDVTNIADVQQTVEGQDAVVVILGTRNDLGKLIFTFRRSRIARSAWAPLYPNCPPLPSPPCTRRFTHIVCVGDALRTWQNELRTSNMAVINLLGNRKIAATQKFKIFRIDY